MKRIFLIATVISGVLGTPTARDTYSVAIRKSTSLSTTPNSDKIPDVQKSANGTPPFISARALNPWVCIAASKKGIWQAAVGTTENDALQSALDFCGRDCDLTECAESGCVAIAWSKRYIVVAGAQMYSDPTTDALRAQNNAYDTCVRLSIQQPCTVSYPTCSNF